MRPWACDFPWGQAQQLGMNGIITHTHTTSAVQVHTSTQADREVDKHKQEHLACQSSTRVNTHTDTAYHYGLNLKQIRQGGKVKRGQSLVFVLSVCSVQQVASLWRLHTDDKAFRVEKINVL